METQPTLDPKKLISRAMRLMGGRQLESLESAGAVLESTVAETVLSSTRLADLQHAVKNSPVHTVLLLDVMGPDEIKGKTEPELVAQGVDLVKTAQVAMAKIAKDGAEAELSPPQLSSLEAIVRLTGRPSLLIQNGDFVGPIDKEWHHLALDVNRAAIKNTIRSVGRVYVALPGRRPVGWGTAWVGGPGLLVTNRHVVADKLGDKSSGSWKLFDGARVWVDFLVEEASAKTCEFQVKRILHVEDEQAGHPDLALLEVETQNVAGEALPPPLSIALNEAEVRVDDDHVYTMGYPGMDESQDAEALQQIFQGIYYRKRLAPGVIMKLDVPTRSMQHDCTTLRGSSGSCLVRLATHKVVGLHFKGVALSENEAVLLAAMASEERLKSYGLHFVP